MVICWATTILIGLCMLPTITGLIPPVLRSDVELLSVNVPPVYFRSHYWLHSISFDLPCPEDSFAPNVRLFTDQMLFSTSEIVKTVQGIQARNLSDGTYYRLQGPIQTFNQTHGVFAHMAENLKQAIHYAETKVASIWGLLPDKVCRTKGNDIADDNLVRVKRQLPDSTPPHGMNTIHVHSSGNTFILGSPAGTFGNIQDTTPSDNLPTDSQMDVLVQSSELFGKSTQKARLTSNPNSSPENSAEQLSPCNIPEVKRLRYITCVMSNIGSESACNKKYLSCVGVSVRRKRGLFDFLGDVQNKLFGVATDEEIKALHDVLDANQNLSLANAAEVALLRNSTITLSNHFVTAMEDLHNQVYTEISELSDHITSWSKTIEAHLGEVDRLLQENSVISTIHTATLTINAYMTMMLHMNEALNRYKTYYKELAQLTIYGKLNPSSVTVEHTKNVWATIRKALSVDLDILDNTDRLKILSSNIFSIYNTDKKLMVLIRIPIILNPTRLTFWVPKTIPIINGDISYRLSMESDILVYRKEDKLWSTLTLAEYNLCNIAHGGVCDQSNPWYTTATGSCHLSLHSGEAKAQDLCEVKPFLSTQVDNVYVVSSDDRTWLISHNGKNDEGHLNCLGEKGLPTRRSSIVIPRVGLVQVPRLCELKVGSIIMVGPPSEIGTSEDIIYPILEHLDTGRLDFTISNISGEIPALRKATQEIKTWRPHTSHTVFNSELESIKSINSKMHGNAELYSDKVATLHALIEEKTAEMDRVLGNSSSWWPNLHWPQLVVPIPSLFNIIIVIWLGWITFKLLTRGAYQTAAGIMLTANNESLLRHKTFAFVIHGAGSSNTTAATTPLTPYWSMVQGYLIWIPLVCLVLMIIFHHTLLSALKASHRKIARQLGWVPINRSCVQHSGESRLLVGVLLRFLGPCGGLLTRREVLFQVVTVPGLASSWYCEENPSLERPFIRGQCNRMSRIINLRMDWRALCLKSRDFTELDTCQDLPRKASVRLQDLIAPAKKHLSWYWTRIEVESLTQVNLVNGSYSRRLYDYSWENMKHDRGLSV